MGLRIAIVADQYESVAGYIDAVDVATGFAGAVDALANIL